MADEPKVNLSQPAPKEEPLQPNEEPVFYNVLPQSRTQGPLVNVENSLIPAVVKKKEPMNPVKKKIYIWGAIAGLVVLGIAGGYYGYLNYQEQQTLKELENFGVPKTLNLGSSTLESQKPISTVGPEWLKKYYGNEVCLDQNTCGDDADLDRDGLKNLEEFQIGTDPSNNDSDRDGIADGDESHVFGSDPLKPRTTSDPNFNDMDYVRGGYDPATSGKKWTDGRLAEVKETIGRLGLHQPTLEGLGPSGRSYYGIEKPVQQETKAPTTTQESATTSLNFGDYLPEDKLERDTQRQQTLKKIALAMLQFRNDRGAFPLVAEFDEAVVLIKPYIIVATNFKDPINRAPLVYSYQPVNSGADFVLSYFSETQNQMIKIRAEDAQKYADLEQAGTFDTQRVSDLQSIQSALLIWSASNIQVNQDFSFPPQNRVKTELVPRYLSQMPKDPRTHADYELIISETRDGFSVRSKLDAAPKGSGYYLCDQDECRYE